jgi:rod shape-determining protein MreC
MKDFFSSVRFKILLAILLVMLGFMIAAVYTVGAGSLFSQGVGLITVPFQRLSAGISDSVAEFFQRFSDSSAMYDENRLLREERSQLLARVADYERLRYENEQFRQVIGMMETRQDLTLVTASVVARDPVSRFYSFTIDKGTLDNVRYLDPVMTADGLVGYVYEVGLTYSKVLTILDISVDVGAYSSATRDIGVVSGTIELAEQGLCQLQYLDRESKASPGDIILTSGGSIFAGSDSLFPRNILIGTVLRVEPNAHGTSLVAVIKPAADIPAVTNVFVIIDFEGKANGNAD